MTYTNKPVSTILSTMAVLLASCLLTHILPKAQAFQPLPTTIYPQSSQHKHVPRPKSVLHHHFHTIQVTHQNTTTTLQVNENESILQALERSKVHDTLALPSLPHECRKGSCLTCSGRLLNKNNDACNKSHRASSKTKPNVEIRRDGLSPTQKKKIEERGLVLTCSGFVVGEGVHIELGVCDDVWREVWDGDDKEGERIRNDAVAKAMRLADEKNLNKWALKTERMLSRPGSGGSRSNSGGQS